MIKIQLCAQPMCILSITFQHSVALRTLTLARLSQLGFEHNDIPIIICMLILRWGYVDA